MSKFQITVSLLLISLALNVYLLIHSYNFDFRKIFPGLSDTGIIYRENCPEVVVKNRICSIEVLEKRGDFAMIRVHYHYKKAHEYSNRIVVKANKGSHDNVIGTKGRFDIVEGDNTIDISFGMYRGGKFTKDAPYTSKYIMVKAQGLTQDSKRYTSPHLLEVYAEYDQPWYTDGDNTSW